MTSTGPTTTEVATLDQLPLMLTVEEVASILRVGRNTAYTAIADGSLPSIRIGSRIRIPRASLASLLGQELSASSARSVGGPIAGTGHDQTPGE